MKVLYIADIIGKPGRSAVRQLLPDLVQEHGIEFVIANGENAAAGFGLTEQVGSELFAMSIDVLTSGNHLWDKKDSVTYIAKEPRILRPSNYPDGAVGSPHGVFKTKRGQKVGVFGLLGRVFMSTVDCPFRAADRVISELKQETDVIIVDVHAEATSEKVALSWYLDGRASAVIGSHTHVQTADERILPQGTACITDAGMTGPFDGVIGMKREIIINKFLTQMPARFEVAEGDVRLNAVLVEINDRTGRAEQILPISKQIK
jgi:hypothetical protein